MSVSYSIYYLKSVKEAIPGIYYSSEVKTSKELVSENYVSGFVVRMNTLEATYDQLKKYHLPKFQDGIATGTCQLKLYINDTFLTNLTDSNLPTYILLHHRCPIGTYNSWSELYTDLKVKLGRNLDMWTSKYLVCLPNRLPIDIGDYVKVIIDDYIVLERNKCTLRENFDIMRYYTLDDLNRMFRTNEIDQAVDKVIQHLFQHWHFAYYDTQDEGDDFIMTNIDVLIRSTNKSFDKIQLTFSIPQK